MSGLDRDALDRHITGGRYSSELGYVTCPCGEQTPVKAETEYGSTEWTPAECKCGRPFTGDEPWEDDDGPDPDRAYDLMREDEAQ